MADLDTEQVCDDPLPQFLTYVSRSARSHQQLRLQKTMPTRVTTLSSLQFRLLSVDHGKCDGRKGRAIATHGDGD
ncbi:hypothetical protein FOIG_14465 [Fusarium odoratissimum NRRL 54006]|uniref:Uncharacterized protein n=2 Tax=Fusarium oxysporum species complex TaxID=171631 RepID=X0J867_FUSO5|nr:uncharacterized protein FOIG_14465 [Fusarium odoratissimum NRRL 54006]EXL92515.1 hypothetical protein FOIG_14465 [Fusarium odoratissimum NRRL 54006]TXC08166.1 hypothetical protein FocTR4_00003291 [Fusarium oxysporum f. sp. cubense]